MYFWNDYRLAKDIEKGLITTDEKFRYFLIYFILFSLTGFYESSRVSPLFRVLDIIFYLTINTVGLFYCYNESKKNNLNKKFFEIFFCLLLPISIKVHTYFLIALFIFVNVIDIFFIKFSNRIMSYPFYDYFIVFYSSIILIYIYKRLIYRIKEISIDSMS